MPENPSIGAAQVRLLQKLCTASAIAGQEGEVRKIVLNELDGQADEIRTDALGNVLAMKKGSGRAGSRLRVMLAAHMDEVGLMITADEKDGIYRFQPVGGLSANQLVGKMVVVGKEHFPGVIGFKPIHLTTGSERKNGPSIDNLRIDTGGAGIGKIKIGDRVTFTPNFLSIGSGSTRTLRSKAMDNRIGVATLIELIKHAPANVDLCAAFTTQEEIGLRGAAVAAYAFDPHLAIALDCTPAYDLPHWNGEENSRYNARLGDGPAIYIADRGTLSDPRLVRLLSETAEAAGIPYQFRQGGGGSTDAGAIHKARAGIPSVSVSVPGRYLHTAASLVRMSDWQNAFRLLHSALTQIRPALLKPARA